MASLIPELGPNAGELHFVLCDFGRNGIAFVETDPTAATHEEVVRNFITGEYRRPVRVIAIDAGRGTARDVSGEIATAVAAAASRELPRGTQDFLASQRVTA
jgi:hypothetical protein